VLNVLINSYPQGSQRTLLAKLEKGQVADCMTTGDTLAACEGRLAVWGGVVGSALLVQRACRRLLNIGGGRWACDPGGGMHMGGALGK